MRASAHTAVFVITLAMAPFAQPAAAQERPAPVAEFAAGTLLFADDGVVREGFVGGTARLYVLPRISVGPEIAYIRGENHSHLMVTGNVTFDLLSPVKGPPRATSRGRTRPVTPFATVGGGLFQTRESFPNETFTSSDGAFTAGGGVRTSLGDYVTAGVEARVGWELHIRVNALVGVRLGKLHASSVSSPSRVDPSYRSLRFDQLRPTTSNQPAAWRPRHVGDD